MGVPWLKIGAAHIHRSPWTKTMQLQNRWACLEKVMPDTKTSHQRGLPRLMCVGIVPRFYMTGKLYTQVMCFVCLYVFSYPLVCLLGSFLIMLVGITTDCILMDNWYGPRHDLALARFPVRNLWRDTCYDLFRSNLMLFVVYHELVHCDLIYSKRARGSALDWIITCTWWCVTTII